MRTKHFKTLRGFLQFISKRDNEGVRVYEPLNAFFNETVYVSWFSDLGGPNEKWHAFHAVLPWELKYAVALEIVNFHWSRRTKSERERIATSLAKGDGDLSFLQSFHVCFRKTDGKWVQEYCTSGLSGPNYDWCKRKYLQSI